jgi:hypothetical protein
MFNGYEAERCFDPADCQRIGPKSNHGRAQAGRSTHRAILRFDILGVSHLEHARLGVAGYCGGSCVDSPHKPRRGEAMGTSEARQMLEYAIENGRGGTSCG